MRTGQREIVDDDVGRVGLAEDVIVRKGCEVSGRTAVLRARSAGQRERGKRTQQHAAAAAPAAGRDPRAQARQRRAQIGILHVHHFAPHLGHDFRRWPDDRPWPCRPRDRALHEPDIVDLAMAEIGIHPLDDLTTHMLNLQRCGAGHLEPQQFCTCLAAAPRDQRLGLGAARQFRPDDRLPIRAQPHDRCQTTAAGSLAGQPGRQRLGEPADSAETAGAPLFLHQAPFKLGRVC